MACSFIPFRFCRSASAQELHRRVKRYSPLLDEGRRALESFLESCDRCGSRNRRPEAVKQPDSSRIGFHWKPPGWHWVPDGLTGQPVRLCPDCEARDPGTPASGHGSFLFVLPADPQSAGYPLDVSTRRLWRPGSFRRLVKALPQLGRVSLTRSIATYGSPKSDDQYHLQVDRYLLDPLDDEARRRAQQHEPRLARSPGRAGSHVAGFWRTFRRWPELPAYVNLRDVQRARSMHLSSEGILVCRFRCEYRSRSYERDRRQVLFRCARVDPRAWFSWIDLW